MIEKKIGFIGCGNMAKTIIGALINKSKISPINILIYDHKLDTNQAMVDQYGVTAAESPENLAHAVDILLVTVKPHVVLKVLKELCFHLKKDVLVVSIAVGVTIASLEAVLSKDQKIIRVMPNIPSLVNEGMASITPNAFVTKEELDEILSIFQSFGKAMIINEQLIHTVIGISGSAPAYIFMLIEAMSDAAVLGGMSRAQAYEFSAQAVKGSAHMLMESGKHPAELKDMVCSPGGTTITALKVLEEKGFRAAVIKAIQKCINKSKKLSKILNSH